MKPSATLQPTDTDVRPVVRLPRRGLSNIAIVMAAIGAGGLLFGILEARRQGSSAPATAVRSDDLSGSLALPPLQFPPEPPLTVPPLSLPPVASSPPESTVQFRPVPSRSPGAAVPVLSSVPDIAGQSSYPSASAAPSAPSGPARVANGPALVLDGGGEGGVAGRSEDREEATTDRERRSGSLSTTRARAGMLANRAATVPQGTLIPAVLETAFDSTSPGFARALVQRDVRGFDGNRVLIPRGSRLIGEYGEDIAQGQRRAVILWVRLIRPDGVTIAIESPSADTLGRGGVKAEVNNHFLERFGGAILQSSLDLGISLAARSARSPVLVALPGSIGGAGRTLTQPVDIRPTLRVAPGRSVSIFVARDLDFTGMAP